MVAIKLPTFAGMVPAIDPHLLGDQHADKTLNSWLYSGALAGVPEMSLIRPLDNPFASKAFRIPEDEADPTYLFRSTWVEFENPNTDFISAPTAADQHKRYYWASSTTVPKYNTLERIKSGLPAFLLGINPLGNLSVNISGGSSSTIVSRAYVATMVTEYGEEGPASMPALANGKLDATYAVTVPGVPANDLGVDRNVKFIRLYRTVISSAGVANYFQIAQLPAQTTAQTYNDTTSDAYAASQPVLESTAWTAPPNLDGIVNMPNGIVAGFIRNELYFSDAYRPHAWPAAYALMLDHDIVGLAVVNQTLVACTRGNPYTASGVNPASITTSRLAAFEPCLSKGSILPTENGVYYTSPNGLVVVNAGYAENVTKQYITRDKWNGVVTRGRVNAGRLGGAYYAFGVGLEQVYDENAFQVSFIQVEEKHGAAEGFMIDPANANAGYVDLMDDDSINSVYNDEYSGEVLLVKNGAVYWLDQRPGFKSSPYLWRSKIFQTTDMRNFAAYKLYFYDPVNYDFTTPQNFNLNQEFDPAHQLAIVRIYADNKLVSAQEVRKSGDLHRLPSGFKASFWQIEIEAAVRVKSFQMATSVKELSVV